MAIAEMTKVIIVSHRTQASELLESLQAAGIFQVLSAEEAAVGKALPEHKAGARARELDETIGRLGRCMEFLHPYALTRKELLARPIVDERHYEKLVGDASLLDAARQCEQVASALDKARSEVEALNAHLAELSPWEGLETPLESLGELEQVSCMTGLLSASALEAVMSKLKDLGAAVETVGGGQARQACVVVCLKEHTEAVQKLLRSVEFEAVGFAGMSGTVREVMAERRARRARHEAEVASLEAKASRLAEHLPDFRVLRDHYENLLEREDARRSAPATEQTVLLEGWVRKTDSKRLEAVVSQFKASSILEVAPAEGDEPPVEIDNPPAIRPFESITRLYGMPARTSVDPTVFLAPFFTIFFGLCLTDAGYGLVMMGVLWYLLRKMRGDKRFAWMLMICAVSTVIAGVLTGGWFGDAPQQFMPQRVQKWRDSMMLFDPMTSPMVFFAIALGLGYFQIMFGLCVALGHNLRNRNYVAAFCDQVTWLVMLNSLVLFGLAKGGILMSGAAGIFLATSVIPAAVILLFSVREGGWPGRIGMGVFNLFCTVFYMGDVLSYVRIMALGMVTGGFGMAVNICVKLVGGAPYVGWLLGAVVFVGGHTLNLALSTLGSFVHSMRLQFVEFFPKFFEGGGRAFEPLRKQYKHSVVEQVRS